MIRFIKRGSGFWRLCWDVERYPNARLVISRLWFQCKKSAYHEVEIVADEHYILFHIPAGVGLYEVGFPNCPETMDALRQIIAYAETVQKEMSPEERSNAIRALKVNKYIK